MSFVRGPVFATKNIYSNLNLVIWNQPNPSWTSTAQPLLVYDISNLTFMFSNSNYAGSEIYESAEISWNVDSKNLCISLFFEKVFLESSICA